jgi:hypothetical protein
MRYLSKRGLSKPASIRVAACFRACGNVPELLQIVELADSLKHYVHHDVREVNQNPLAGILTFHAQRALTGPFTVLNDGIRERADVAIRTPRYDHHHVGYGRQMPNVHAFDGLTFQLIQCPYN